MLFRRGGIVDDLDCGPCIAAAGVEDILCLLLYRCVYYGISSALCRYDPDNEQVIIEAFRPPPTNLVAAGPSGILTAKLAASGMSHSEVSSIPCSAPAVPTAWQRAPEAPHWPEPSPADMAAFKQRAVELLAAEKLRRASELRDPSIEKGGEQGLSLLLASR